MTKQEAELRETIGQVRAVRRFLGNLEKFGPETGERGMNHLAAKRIEKALLECLRRATDELHDGSTDERLLFMQAEIATLETHHYIDEPIRRPRRQTMAEQFMQNGREIK